jgi:hypothetical protein
MRDLVAEVRPVRDIEQAKREGREKWIALQDAERATQKAAEQHESKRQNEARARLEMGQFLIRERGKFPKSGRNAKHWGELLADIGIDQPRAWELMKYAGYVEERSGQWSDHISSESLYSDENLPSLRDAGIDKKPRKNEIDDSREVPDSEREEIYRREVEGALPLPMAKRERSTHEVIEIAANARVQLLALSEKNIHLTDVTTSPEDFMRAKQLFIDIVNRGLDELERAGVLDGKESRRQLKLIDGGKQ